ncbi:hypothetical protein [Martelella sp. FOR1707]
MQVDKSRYPFVFLRETALPRTENPELELGAILAKGSPFILISDIPPHDESNESPEVKKARALFFKRHKALFLRNCAGAIVIEGAKATPMPLRMAAQAFGKAFGVPVHFAPDENAAVELGEKLFMDTTSAETPEE